MSENIFTFKWLNFWSQDSWGVRNNHSSWFPYVETCLSRHLLLSAAVKEGKKGGHIHPPTLNCPSGDPSPFSPLVLASIFTHINFYRSCSTPINVLQRLWQKTQYPGTSLSSEEEGLFTFRPRWQLFLFPSYKWNCISDPRLCSEVLKWCRAHTNRNMKCTGRIQGRPQKGACSSHGVLMVSLISGTWGVMWDIPL